MLATLNDVLKIAEGKGCALGAFNTPDLASMHAIINAAEQLNMPIVIMHAQIHEEKGLATLDEIGPIMLFAADRAKVPICVHLDHGTDFDYIKRALDIGYTSVMYEGSMLPLEENIANTSYVVQLSAKYGASVEGEVGSMGSREGGDAELNHSIYTEPDIAKRFVDETGIDALACAFGAAHGFYVKEPKLDFERVSKINSMIDVPMVMHGGSGVSDEDFKEVIKRGIRKVNYYTYMAKAGADAVNGKTFKEYSDVVAAAELAMCENIKNAIKVFSLTK